MVESPRNVVRLQNVEAIEEEASEWFARMRSDDLTQEDIAEFEAWRGQSDRHGQIYRELEAYWRDFSSLDTLEDLGRETLGCWPERKSIGRRQIVGIAASLTAIVIGGAFFADYRNSSKIQQEAFSTAVGEQRTVVLSDGSRVQLNTRSDIEINYSADARIVRLPAGEAHFEVVRDQRRPFTVATAGGSVTAVGTAFSVRVHEGDQMEVAVTEGRVALSSRFEGGQLVRPVAELTKGQVVLFEERVQQIEHVTEADLNRKLSWRQGMLAYSGETLGQVIDDISRYTTVKIEIADPELLDIPIQGFFKVGEVEALFDTLELTFGLHIDRVDENLVRVGAST